MAKTITFGLQKGGVGKTTSTLLIGYLLAKHLEETKSDKKVLLLDFDAQGNLTEGLGCEPDDFEGYTIFDVILGRNSVEKCIIEYESLPNLNFIPANEDLSSLSLFLFDNKEVLGGDAFYLLKDCLEPIAHQYEYILIDLPPSRDLITMLGLAASDYVIIPMQISTWALKAVPKFLKTIDEVNSKIDGKLKVMGILMTMFEVTKKIHMKLLKIARQQYGDLIFDTAIKRTVRLEEQALTGPSPKAKEIQESYGEFIKELMEYVKKEGQ